MEPVEVFSATTHRACTERALVLRTLEIPFDIRQQGGTCSVWVSAEHASRALSELAEYEEENRDWPPHEELPVAMPASFQGGVVYFATILLTFVLAANQAFGIDWQRIGVAHAGAIQSGELWRACTALGLHTGPPHLLSNLIFGLFFGWFVTWSHGGGLGWLLILIAGILGNITNAWLLSPDHLSVGASTAVFGAVGILVGTEWRRRYLIRANRIKRIAPILMGFLIFSFVGVGDERTDITAHLTGLVWGVPIGMLALHLPEALTRNLRNQLYFGIGALALFFGSWLVATI